MGKFPGCELLILALGRLGGEALTHASDLDLIFLYSPAITVWILMARGRWAEPNILIAWRKG